MSCKNVWLFALIVTAAGCQETTTPTSAGIFSTLADIGKIAHKGSVVYNDSLQEYTIKGSGENMWFQEDAFYLASLNMKGDFILTTNCRFEGEGKNAHRKMGLIIREGLETDARYADAAVHGDGLTSLQYRDTVGANTKEVNAELIAPDIIQLERNGSSVIMRAAKWGEPLQETGRIELSFGDSVYAGIFICSHEEFFSETARFSNFRIDIPAAEGVDGYRTPSASRIEIVDIETGVRRVVYATSDHIEANNWSADGKYLIYNSNGLLYKFPLDTKIPEQIPTGDVVKNNNDHVLSFDGKMIGISSSTKVADGREGSMVYTVPVEGGIPKAITPNIPSYFHGWSPDGKTLVYCAERNGDYDVWGIPSEGGEEFQLTRSPGLDDGPEYSPDGKYIYFNSVRSGLMKIWRMAPDGSNQEQVSFGPYNDWFAHISPDGSQMIYISYPETVPPGSHPHNQHVMLRLQKVDSRESKVVASLYGGQGTLNVPSWSPCGKYVAFMSYTYGDPNQ